MPIEPSVVLVTGGTGVVGAGVVRHLLEEGRRVALAYSRSGTVFEQLRSELDADPRQLIGISADLSTEEGSNALIERLADARLDVSALVYSAAIVDHTPIDKLTAETFSEVFAVNVTAAFLLVRELARRPSFRAAVLLSSIGADFTGTGSMAYEASKGAVNSLTRALAAELAPGVRVNGVAPGVVRSHRTEGDPLLSSSEFVERIPERSLVEPDRVAEVIGFLLSDQSRFITGQVLRVDGGLSLRLL